MSDETARARERERELNPGDALAVQRVAIERRRAGEDPLERLAALVARAHGLYRDSHFTMKEVVHALRRGSERAERNAVEGVALPGFVWVRKSGGEPGVELMAWAKTDHKRVAGSPRRFGPMPGPIVEADSTEASGPHARASEGIDAERCQECGAVYMVGSRCVLEVKAEARSSAVVYEPVSVTWWTGSASRSEAGIRHFALVYWDGALGVVAVEIRTGTSQQRVSSVFPVLTERRRRSGRGARNVPRETMRAWAVDRDPSRVLMTTRWVEGPERCGFAVPLWNDEFCKSREDGR